MRVPHLRRSSIATKAGVTNPRPSQVSSSPPPWGISYRLPSPTTKAVILSLRCPRGQVVVRGVWKRRISCRLPIAHHKGSHPERSAAEPKDLRLPLPLHLWLPLPLRLQLPLHFSPVTPAGSLLLSVYQYHGPAESMTQGMLQLAHRSPNPPIPNEGPFHLCPSAKGALSSQPRPSAWVESP